MGGPWYPNVIATACIWPCPYTSIDMVYSHDWDCNEIKKTEDEKYSLRHLDSVPV